VATLLSAVESKRNWDAGERAEERSECVGKEIGPELCGHWDPPWSRVRAPNDQHQARGGSFRLARISRA